MASASSTTTTAARQWFIVGRWHEYEGESRANLLRIIGIGAFYIVELLNYEVFQAVERPMHQQVTALAVAWTMVALGVLLCLRRRIFPAALKYVTTACDLILLTAMIVAVRGPASPLVVIYFLIIALAALRFSLPLVWFATLGALVGYTCTLGCGNPDYFPIRGFQFAGVPRNEQLIVLIGLALAGIILGQVIRRVRNVAEEYARRVDAKRSLVMTRGDMQTMARRCPDCNAVVLASESACWLCGKSFANGFPPRSQGPPGNALPRGSASQALPSESAAAQAGGACNSGVPRREPGNEENVPKLRPTFALSTLLLLITIIAVSLGVGREWLWGGIGFFVLVTPAFIRTAVAAAKDRAAGRPMSPGEKYAAFMGSLGVVIVIAVASSVAFFATCFGSVFAGAGIAELADTRDPYSPLIFGFIVGLILGGILAIVVAVFTIKKLWPRRGLPSQVENK